MKYYLFILIYFFTNACISHDKLSPNIGGFDISKDDKQILFTYNQGNESSIYKISSDGNELKLLIKSENNKGFANPRFGNDDKNFLFIEYDLKNFQKSKLNFASSDGKNIENLIGGEGIITEAIFSKNKKEILFCKANEYSKYSPIGVKDFHGFDIYSMNISDKKISKLTNINAYGINHISEIDSSYILFRLESGPESGMYFISKEHLNVMKRYDPVVVKKNDASMYQDPVYFQKYKVLAFTYPYEIYKMDIENNKAEFLYRSRSGGHIQEIRNFNSTNRILFIEVEELFFSSINLNGEDLQEIRIDGITEP